MASFHPHSLFQALLVLEPARTNRRTTSPACRRAQVVPSDLVRDEISKKHHALHASAEARVRSPVAIRAQRAAQRAIDLGSIGHEQNRSRSPCSVFSSMRPPWPCAVHCDFLNCWPPLAGGESPTKPCKVGPGRCVRMREELGGRRYIHPYLPPFPCNTSLTRRTGAGATERETTPTLASVRNPNTCAISMVPEGERELWLSFKELGAHGWAFSE